MESTRRPKRPGYPFPLLIRLGAMWLTRMMESLLFSISPNDPTTFIAVPTVLVVVALAASYVPVRRALQVDPTIALRAE